MSWTLRIMLILATVVGFVALFRKRETPARASSVGAMTELRELAFQTDPAAVGISASPGEAWGVLMDMGLPKGAATVLSLSDGTASVYVSTGGGYIGGEGVPAVREAAKKFVRSATANIAKFKPTSEHPLPPVGHTRFYVLTPEGLVTAEGKTDELGENRHDLSLLFAAGQEVITQFRLDSETKSKS